MLISLRKLNALGQRFEKVQLSMTIP